MKCGIKALFITLAIATTGMSAGALATTPAAKTPAVQTSLTQRHPQLARRKPRMPEKARMMTVRESVSIRHRQRISPG